MRDFGIRESLENKKGGVKMNKIKELINAWWKKLTG